MSVGPAETRRWARLHRLLLLLVCVGIPAESWLGDDGARAWTMYARSDAFRLRIRADDGDGRAWWIAPTELAARASGDLRTVLSGTEQFQLGPQGRTLRNHLGALAGFACAAAPGARRVSLTLSLRAREDGPVEDVTEALQCGAR
ncbi:MAG TPA: hypothetical protein VHE30_14135 [Polyangiaceae bacterium]|nr:hypothetical protein [Polyangiaceae bacterium]